MKRIPNILSILRIFLSICLFLFKNSNPLFWIIYITCGFSDMADGYIARKTKSESKLGAILDSIADIVFMTAAVCTLPTRF